MQLTLAVVVVLSVVAGSVAGIWYVNYRSDRELRQATLTREVTAALDDAQKQLDGLHDSLEHPLKIAELLSDIERWQAIVNGARTSWKHARSLARGNEDLLDPAVTARLREAEAQIKADQASYQLARKLDDIRLKASESVEGKVNLASSAPRYAAFFAGQGLDFSKGSLAELAEAVRRSPIRYALVAGLDDWATALQYRKSYSNKLLLSLLAVARRADPDPWRDQFRQAVAVGLGLPKIKQLANEVQPAHQTPQILRALAEHLSGRGGDAVPLLHAALGKYPRDFWLNLSLARYFKEPMRQEGYYQAALTLRPKSALAHFMLGIVLYVQKDYKEARAKFEQAIALDPKYALAYYGLGILRYAEKDYKEARTKFKKAIALDPELALAYGNHGLV
jgi:tetratricopeptide (TPR) repeat protein